MRCGLYGKLPMKRDFVALSTTREFLSVWEPWIQAGVSASSHRLGEAWKTAYLRAPIWRFWLGAELAGSAALGAFMPSLDGVGRYFPLTLVVAEIDGPIPPPEFEPQAEWFAAAESLLLSTLEEGMTFEAVSAALAALPPPTDRPPLVKLAGTTLADGTLLMPAEEPSFQEIFAAARVKGFAAAYAAATFWWTAGGEGFPALALARRRMPDPYLFTGMLTGNFNSGVD